MSTREKDWTIGIVSEGPTDYTLFNGVVREITGCTKDCRRIQPEYPIGKNPCGTGWKGVLRWCQKHDVKWDTDKECLVVRAVEMDLLIIHLDGDVSREEENKVVHCMSGCSSARNCPDYGQEKTNPLNCDTKQCPVKIPCPEHPPNPGGYVSHLSGLIRGLLNAPAEASDRICPVIVCDSMEAWIISAYDKTPNPEAILNPYETVITKSKAYHGLRIHRKGNKKDITVYREFLKTLKANWEHVKTQCPSARKFEDSVCHALQIAPAKSP